MRRGALSFVPIVGLFLLLLVSLYFMSNATQDPERFGQWYIGLLLFNVGLLVVLFILIFLRLAGLIRDLLTRAEGSRLTWRLVLMFSIIALVPVLLVYSFSTRFISSGIDSWFDVRIERSLEDALQLARLSLEQRKANYLRGTVEAAQQMARLGDVRASVELDAYRHRLEADELTLLGKNNRIITTSNDDTGQVVPRLPTADMALVLESGRSYVGIEPAAGGGLSVWAAAYVPLVDPGDEQRLLLAKYSLADQVSHLASQVESAYDDYRGLVFLRGPLKQSFSVTLLLVLLLTSLFALWAAFYMAQRMLSPIVELAGATQAVAEGNYEQKLPVLQHDELGFLVQSFNAMTSGIKHAREDADYNQRVAERQKSYLETVLAHLSSGVLTLDENLVLRTANEVASRIFETHEPLASYVGKHVADIARVEPLFESFYDHIFKRLIDGSTEWREEVPLFGDLGRKLLLTRGVGLPAENGEERGWVVVFDDVTELIRAQRDAAWGEAARRLAHEIKNPLTPIQLSAERIEYKLSPLLPPAETEMVARATRTIVQQVESMRDMVNEFRDYASPPKIHLDIEDLNQLINGLSDLYQAQPNGIEVKFFLQEGLPKICADAGKIRQVLHNMIKNAVEAIGDNAGIVEVRTRAIEIGQGRYVELSISDTGPGIAADLLGNLFDPYVTGKPKGTGLGLAIVRKIIEEHDGTITVSNLPEAGARFVIRLPEVHPKDKA